MKRPQSKTKMKRLTDRDGFEILELGDLLYFFYPTEPTNRVIISAHGGHALLSNANQFTVPSDVVLQFYSTDKNSVIDPGFSNFYQSEAAPMEIITEGDRSFDYLLSKYQGRHGSKTETYDSIARDIRDMNKAKTDAVGWAKNATGKNLDKFNHIAARSKIAAVITVRNRMFKGSATLSMVVDAVKTHAPEIVIFDCLFCRSPTIGGGSNKVPLISRNLN